MSKTFLKKLKEKWQTAMVLIFMTVAIVFSISIFMPAKYSSETKLIVIQNHQSEKVDAFSAAKSAEYLSDIISKVIFTESFMENVFSAPFEVENNLPLGSENKMKAWEKKIDVSKENNTGILTINVFDKSKIQAEKLTNSIAWALNVHGADYHGGGKTVKIKLIDGPITSERPAVPNVLLNTLFALFVGVSGSLVVIYFFDDFELVLFRKKEFYQENVVDDNEEVMEKITLGLERIRENLKNQKNSLLVEDEYQIEKKDHLKENFDQIEKAFENEEREINTENLGKKSQSPKNLPVFDDEDKPEKEDKFLEEKSKEGKSNLNINNSKKDFISLEELNEEAEKMDLAGKKKDATKYEASSEEVKERLNKLLRGEL